MSQMGGNAPLAVIAVLKDIGVTGRLRLLVEGAAAARYIDSRMKLVGTPRSCKVAASVGRGIFDRPALPWGGVMTTILIALAVLILTFGAGMLGLYLQKRLPQEHMSGGSRDMILAVIGLVTLLLALVLGTLVGNTYAFFAGQKAELETLASRAILLDQALGQYGPETKPARDRMKEGLTQSYELFWRGGDADPNQLKVDVPLARWQPLADYLGSLEPTTPKQKQALSAAGINFGLMQQTRIMMSLQLASPVAWSLLIIVICWASFLFCGFGVLSGTNHTTIVALGLGAFAIATAVFLILDMSQPYSGMFRIPAGALQQAIEVIDK
jgi:hypothetical protein